jgi:hypothetical protein
MSQLASFGPTKRLSRLAQAAADAKLGGSWAAAAFVSPSSGQDQAVLAPPQWQGLGITYSVVEFRAQLSLLSQ